nr:hypothetical protein [Nitratifractor salsuginis]
MAYIDRKEGMRWVKETDELSRMLMGLKKNYG